MRDATDIPWSARASRLCETTGETLKAITDREATGASQATGAAQATRGCLPQCLPQRCPEAADSGCKLPSGRLTQPPGIGPSYWSCSSARLFRHLGCRTARSARRRLTEGPTAPRQARTRQWDFSCYTSWVSPNPVCEGVSCALEHHSVAGWCWRLLAFSEGSMKRPQRSAWGRAIRRPFPRTDLPRRRPSSSIDHPAGGGPLVAHPAAFHGVRWNSE